MLKETNTPTRPRIEPGFPDPESDALTIRPVRPPAAHSEPRRDEIIVIEVVYDEVRLMFSMFMPPTLKMLMGHIAFGACVRA